jgi:hypothetical protein
MKHLMQENQREQFARLDAAAVLIHPQSEIVHGGNVRPTVLGKVAIKAIVIPRAAGNMKF